MKASSKTSSRWTAAWLQGRRFSLPAPALGPATLRRPAQDVGCAARLLATMPARPQKDFVLMAFARQASARQALVCQAFVQRQHPTQDPAPATPPLVLGRFDRNARLPDCPHCEGNSYASSLMQHYHIVCAIQLQLSFATPRAYDDFFRASGSQLRSARRMRHRSRNARKKSIGRSALPATSCHTRSGTSIIPHGSSGYLRRFVRRM